jgi:hypothetical protein
MVEYARIAGSGYRCPRFHVIQDAASQELLAASMKPAARDIDATAARPTALSPQLGVDARARCRTVSGGRGTVLASPGSKSSP